MNPLTNENRLSHQITIERNHSTNSCLLISHGHTHGERAREVESWTAQKSSGTPRQPCHINSPISQSHPTQTSNETEALPQRVSLGLYERIQVISTDEDDIDTDSQASVGHVPQNDRSRDAGRNEDPVNFR